MAILTDIKWLYRGHTISPTHVLCFITSIYPVHEPISHLYINGLFQGELCHPCYIIHDIVFSEGNGLQLYVVSRHLLYYVSSPPPALGASGDIQIYCGFLSLKCEFASASFKVTGGHYFSKLTLLMRYFLQFYLDGFQIKTLGKHRIRPLIDLIFCDHASIFKVRLGCYVSKLLILLCNTKTTEASTFAGNTLLS